MATDKPKLDNARKMRGFNLIDPDDQFGTSNGSSYALQAEDVLA